MPSLKNANRTLILVLRVDLQIPRDYLQQAALSHARSLNNIAHGDELRAQ